MVVLRFAGFVGVRRLAYWPHTMRLGLVVMFLFTGATHFTAMKYDYAAMIPPPFTGELWIIAATGALEIAGAVGLMVRTTRRTAAICLAILLIALFPANIYAARYGVPFRGEPPTQLWLRALIQLVFLLAVWWSSIRRSSEIPGWDESGRPTTR